MSRGNPVIIKCQGFLPERAALLAEFLMILPPEETALRVLPAAYAGSFHKTALFPVFMEFPIAAMRISLGAARHSNGICRAFA